MKVKSNSFLTSGFFLTKKKCQSLLVFLGVFVSLTLSAQNHSVSGVVKDKKGETLIGVTAIVKGTTNGTVSDIEGRYSISSVSANDIIVFSSIGYMNKEVSIDNRSIIDVILEEEDQILNEIIVVGYGTQKKSDLTGSVVSVKADDMNAIPTSSVAEMLRGQAAGIVVTQNSARPGGGSDIVIRGKKSLTGGNSPLFIVDGVPVTSIDDFNSQDIESVEVLKDASSQAIYGARASNGVILITTKSGADNKTVVDFSTYVGTQQLKRNFDFYSGDEWIQLKREANRAYTMEADGTYATEYLGGDPVDGIYPGDESLFGNMHPNLVDRNFTDWEDLMIKPAIQQKYDLSVRTGNEKTKITTSIGYFDQKGMVKPSSYNRANARFNLNQKISEKVSIGVNTSYTSSKRKQEDGSFNKFITQSPLLNPTDADGALLPMLADSKWNPIWNNKNMINEMETNRLMMNVTFDWKIIKGLNYRLNASLNSRESERGIYLNSKHEKGSTSGGDATLQLDNTKDYLLENIFTYDYRINTTNKFDVTLVQSVNTINEKRTKMSGYGFTTDDLGYDNIGAASKTDPVARSIIPRNLASYMGRLRYNLAERYLFSASARIDGSSVFGANNKWGVFPAASFAWRISEEQFMQSNSHWLSNLKLRVSYGDVGNQAISPYQSQGLVDNYFMQFGNGNALVGYLPGTQLSNPDLKWETTSSLNLGLDFGMLRNRISGALEYYYSVTKDLLVNRSINETSGYSSQLVNMGEVLNEGVELTLNFVPVRVNNLTWNIDLNFATNKNEILALTGELDVDGKLKNDLANNWFIGHNIDAYYDYEFDGIWQMDDEIPDYGPNYKPEPGDIRVKDINNDNVIDSEDRIIIDRSPDWTGSLSSTVKWHNIDFSFDFYTVQGGIRRNSYLYDSNSGGDLHGNLNGIKVDYWTLENPSNSAPRPRDATISYFSSLSYQDASYIRLRNLSLGYSFSEKLMTPLNISNLRVYATATNLWTQTKFKSYSPETSAGGYPEPKTFVIGLNVSF